MPSGSSNYRGATSTFTIEGNDFMKDGAAFRILSGSVHYWRSHPEDWKDRLQLAKQMGVNTITFYVGWWLHEPEDGTFDFTSPDRDVVEFVRTIHEVGLLAICRVGPYITAEVDFGGFPWFLANKNLTIRSSDPAYLTYVDRYFAKMVPLLAPFEYAFQSTTDLPIQN